LPGNIAGLPHCKDTGGKLTGLIRRFDERSKGERITGLQRHGARFGEKQGLQLTGGQGGAVQLLMGQAEPKGIAYESAGCDLYLGALVEITHEASSAGYGRMAAPLPPEQAAQVGGFRDSPVVRDAWARTLASARALGAEVILFQTPASFTPTDANRDALRRFFGEIAADHDRITLAWEPQGLWEPQLASALANEIGLVYALDPLQLETPPPDEPRAYFRIHGLGIYRGKLGDDLLELLADMVDSYERAWVVFANVEKLGDATRFHRLLGGRAFVDDED
jgi:uncharacterized protein YecE (DUF72 family)